MTSRTTRTELVTHDGLRVYDLVPLAVDLWAVAGPDGVDPATIDPDALPDGCRWLDDDEWPRLNAASGATYAGLHDEIKARETTLAPGSETAIYGDFVAAMADAGGKDWRESGEPVDPAAAAWWLRAYDLYAADQARPEDERVADVQEIFDAV